MSSNNDNVFSPKPRRSHVISDNQTDQRMQRRFNPSPELRLKRDNTEGSVGSRPSDIGRMIIMNQPRGTPSLRGEATSPQQFRMTLSRVSPDKPLDDSFEEEFKNYETKPKMATIPNQGEQQLQTGQTSLSSVRLKATLSNDLKPKLDPFLNRAGLREASKVQLKKRGSLESDLRGSIDQAKQPESGVKLQQPSTSLHGKQILAQKQRPLFKGTDQSGNLVGQKSPGEAANSAGRQPANPETKSHSKPGRTFGRLGTHELPPHGETLIDRSNNSNFSSFKQKNLLDEKKSRFFAHKDNSKDSVDLGKLNSPFSDQESEDPRSGFRARTQIMPLDNHSTSNIVLDGLFAKDGKSDQVQMEADEIRRLLDSKKKLQSSMNTANANQVHHQHTGLGVSEFNEFFSVNNSIEPALQGGRQPEEDYALQHATSLEVHIQEKNKKKAEFQQSHFQYQKNLRFMNPLSPWQLILILSALAWQIFYPLVFIIRKYDGGSCSFGGQGQQAFFGGEFIAFFAIFLSVVDMHALIVRVYLYAIMNKNDEANHQKSERTGSNPQRSASFSEIQAKDPEKAKEEAQADLRCKIFWLIPMFILGIMYEYSQQYILAIDLAMTLALVERDLPMWILCLVLLLLISKVALHLISLYDFMQRYWAFTKENKTFTAMHIDYGLIKTNCLNVSNILFARITSSKVRDRFLKKIFVREASLLLGTAVSRIILLSDSSFQAICGEANNGFLKWSMVMAVIIFIRVAHYFNKRIYRSKESDENVVLAVEYLQKHVNSEEQLTLVIDNLNCDFIIQHFENFLKLSKLSNYKQGSIQHGGIDARKLKAIALKFDCTLYHKIYKEDILKIILLNQKTINSVTKVQELRLFKTVLSNRDFYYLGQVIGSVYMIKVISIDHCLLMTDHLFKKKLNQKPKRQGTEVWFEQEIGHYLRGGLAKRRKHIEQQHELQEFERVAHLDLSFVFAHPLDMDTFDSHICGYYQKVQLNKKRLFEEIGGLVSEFEFVSLYLRVSQPGFKSKRNSKGSVTSGVDTRKQIQQQLKILNNKSSSLSEAQLDGASDDEPQNYPKGSQKTRLKMKKLVLSLNKREEIYDKTDLDFLAKFAKERSNILFFTQRRLNLLLGEMANEYCLNINLIAVPNFFHVVKNFSSKDYLTKEALAASSPEALEKYGSFVPFSARTEDESESEEEQPDVVCQTIEERTFCDLIIQKIQNSKFIQALKFRVSAGGQTRGEGERFFHFTKKQSLTILAILRENSSFTILKELEISSEETAEELATQQLVSPRMEKFLGETCSHLRQLTSLSLKSIRIQKLGPFIQDLLQTNEQLCSLAIINCSPDLDLTEGFFQIFEQRKFRKISFRGNNAHASSVECLCHFIVFLLRNEEVDFSNNPIFLKPLFEAEGSAASAVSMLLEIAYMDEVVMSTAPALNSLDLSSTYLGADIMNQVNFFILLEQVLRNRKNKVKKICLKDNKLETLDSDKLTWKLLRGSIDEFRVTPHPFEVFFKNTIADRMHIDLSSNLLRVHDLNTLQIAASSCSALPDQAGELKLDLNLSSNKINLFEINPTSFGLFSKLTDTFALFDYLVELLIERIPKAEAAESAKPPMKLGLSGSDQKKAERRLAEILLDDRTPSDPEMKTRHELQKKLFQKYQDLKNSRVNAAYSLFTLDVSDQIQDKPKKQSDPVVSQVHAVRLRAAHFKERLIGLVSDSRAQPHLTQPFAKYLLKILKKIDKIWKEHKIYCSLYPFKAKFNLEGYQNLRQLRLSGPSLSEHDEVVKMLRLIQNKKIPLQLLDLSRLAVSPIICKEISYIGRETQALREIYLDKTGITLSGIMFILMAFSEKHNADRNFTLFEEEKKTSKNQILLDVSQADNLSLAGGIAHSAFDFPLKKRDFNVYDKAEEEEKALLNEPSENASSLPKATNFDQGSGRQNTTAIYSAYLSGQKIRTGQKSKQNSISHAPDDKASSVRQAKIGEYLSGKKMDSFLIGQQNSQREISERVLDMLSLRHNNLGFQIFKRMKSKQLSNVAVRALDLSDNILKDKGAKHLADYLAGNAFIEKVLLNNNGLTEEGAVRIVDCFKLCPNLRSLSLAANERMPKIVEMCERRGRLSEELQNINYI